MVMRLDFVISTINMAVRLDFASMRLYVIFTTA